MKKYLRWVETAKNYLWKKWRNLNFTPHTSVDEPFE